MNFNFPINLKQLSMCRLAVVLWESPSVRNEITLHSAEMFDGDTSTPFDRKSKWYKLTKKISSQISSHLPEEVTFELRDIIFLVGRLIFYWGLHVKERKVMHVKYIPNYYLTAQGTIDECKTYNFLKRDSFFPANDESIKNRLFLFTLACFNADVKFIQHSLKEIAEIIWNVLAIKIKDLRNFKVQSAMTILILHYRSVTVKENFFEMYNNVKKSKYANGADEMFMICIEMMKKPAAEYFYLKLKKYNSPSLLEEAAWGTGVFYNTVTDRTCHEREKSPDTFLYVLMKMTDEQQKKFLIRYIKTVYAFIIAFWPYQRLSYKLLDYVWNNLQLRDQLMLLEATLDRFILHAYAHDDLYNRIFLPRLQNILERLPEKPKIEYFRYRPYVYNLLKISNFAAIKVIVKDPDLIKHRSELLTDMNKSLLTTYLLDGGQSKNITDYMNVFELSDEEKKKFLKFSDIGLLKQLLINGRMDAANDVCEWKCYLDDTNITEFKKMMKMQFSVVFKICMTIIETDYDIDKLKKYLKWQFDGCEEEIAEFKKKISEMRETSINSYEMATVKKVFYRLKF